MQKIISLLFLTQSAVLFAQAPVIEGENILCVNTTHTAIVTNGVTYDTYQWYSKFSYDDEAVFEPIVGETSDSYTYGIDMNEFTIKLVTTLGGTTYESNEIAFDVFWSFGVLVQSEINGDGGYTDEYGSHFCEGESITYTLLQPFTHNVTWYRDEIEIEGQTSTTLTVTEPGYYHAKAATELCPEDYQYSLGLTAIMENCGTASIDDKNYISDLKIYPNPVKDYLYFELKQENTLISYEIYSVEGKKISSNNLTPTVNIISIENIASGTYILKLKGEKYSVTRKFIKE